MRGSALWASVACGATALVLCHLLFHAALEPSANRAESIDQVREPLLGTPETTEPARGDGSRAGGAGYAAEVGAIQAAAVEALEDSNDRLLRYDSLTAADVRMMRESRAELGRMERLAEGLDPPERRAEHHALFLSAVGVMRSAGETSYDLASDPVDATWPRFREHGMLLEEADGLLRRSNEMLGRDYETVGTASPGDPGKDGT